MEYYFKEIENFIKKDILSYPKNIQNKVEYFLQDGKRLRPILCIIFGGICIKDRDIDINISLDTNTKIIYSIASTIEKLHCLSLVIDDLPEMDNDALRRGKQSFYAKYSTDYTNFFIYYMFNHIGLSLDILLDSLETNYDIEIFNRINKLFTYNLNILIDGQYNDCNFLEKQDLEQDLENPARKGGSSREPLVHSQETFDLKRNKKKLEITQFKDEIEIILQLLDNSKDIDINIISNLEINMKKTSSLFNLPICSGFILQIWKNKYDLEKFEIIIAKLSTWSNILGYMFQISDDILDIVDDKEKGSPNICHIIGRENTCILLKNGCEWLKNMINNIYIECKMMILDINLDMKLDNVIYFNLNTINEIIEKILKRV